MRVLTDLQLSDWVEKNVVLDYEIYWPTETIRAFESHVLEIYEEQGLVSEPPERTEP